MKQNLLLEYQGLWESTCLEYYNNIEKLELPVLPDYIEKDCYQTEDLSIEDRMFNFVKLCLPYYYSFQMMHMTWYQIYQL